MVKRAISISALILLYQGSASADMVAGEFSCNSENSRVNWVGAAPAEAVSVGGSCGGLVPCPTSPTDFIPLAESLGCRGAVSGSFSPFVCTGNRNRLNTIIGELCEATIP
jgi:hypothetical protein